MIELEQKLRAAMHAAVDDEQPPRDLTTRVVRRHRRRTAVMASLSVAACAAVAIAVLPAVLPSHRSAPIGPGRSTSPPEPGHGLPPLKPGRATSKLHGAAMPRGSDVRLLFDGVDLEWYSTVTRRTVPIAGLGQVGPDIGPVRIPGGFLVYTPHGNLANQCCEGAPLYYIADGANAARRIGIASFGAPSSSADALWLINVSILMRSVRNGLRPQLLHPIQARLVGPDGRPIGGPVTLPGLHTVFAGVGKYLLLARIDYSAGTWAELWDPASRRVVRTFGHVDAADPEHVAWSQSCDGCPVHVFDARTGHDSSIAIPRGSRVVAGGAFTSDGTLLAVQLTTGADGHGAARTERLAVIDLATGRLLIVPGVDLTPRALGFLFSYGWQPDTHRLALTLGGPKGTAIQVGYWQPGAARLRLTTARVPPGTAGVYVP